MTALRLFVDTHDVAEGTFPANLTRAQFDQVAGQYLAACAEEGVVLRQVEVSLADGRAFCLTLAPDEAAVRRAHERIGLPIGSITEVVSVAPPAAA